MGKNLQSFNEHSKNEKLDLSDVMFSFEDMKVFSKWCLENKQYT